MRNQSPKQVVNQEQEVSAIDAAKLLGISRAEIQLLQTQEILHPIRQKDGISFFLKDDILRITTNKGLTLSDEAEQVGASMQREIASSLSSMQKNLIVVGIGIFGYFFFIVIFALLFTLFPLQTANWLGYVSRTSLLLNNKNNSNNVLGAATAALNNPQTTLLQSVLHPLSKISLGLVKATNPEAYNEIAKVTIIDPNDILKTETNGVITPLRTINVANSSMFQINDAGLIQNLNSQFLQGKKPGTAVGDIAIIGPDGQIEGISFPTTTNQNSTPANLTTSNISTDTTITNAQLENDGLTINTTGLLTGGGAIALGEALTLACPTCATSNPSIDLSSKVTNTLPVANGGTGAVSFTTNGLLYGNGTNGLQTLAPGTSGYILQTNGSNNAPSWVAASSLSLSSFSGSFSGDITGTQNLTVVEKINGNPLGATTTTAGNLLIGNGTAWVTQQVSGDATITGGGVLSLKNTGTAGTYGSTTDIPVVTTDAQGRVTSVINTSISGLTLTHFSSPNISQWTNNAGYITSSSTDTVTNKTIAAGSNTISGLTNANLSGTAGISNANLQNSSLTISTGTGLSGGATVALGGGITLTNTGVTSLTGTTNQVTVSNATGDVTLSLPQNIATTSTPTLAGLTLTNTSNQLNLGTTNIGTLSWSPTTTRLLTMPDANDTLIGKATTDVLTNKTLTSPTINGTITTTGLTLPAFTASGNITGSGSPTISSFGTINGLTLTATTDGLTIEGGTTSRTMTVTGADITLGSIIKPTSNGALTIQSNGAQLLSLDSGGLSGINIGTTNASTVTIGKAGMTTSIQGTASANTQIIGNGTTITKHLSTTSTFDAPGVTLGSCADIGTVTVTGATVGDTTTATPTPTTGGIETLLLNWNAYVSSSNTVTIRACSVATLGTQNPSSQTWRVDVWQH